MTTIWIAAAIVGIIVLRRFSAVAGSAFAMLVTIVLGVWGYWSYHEGGGVGIIFADRKIPEMGFYAILGIWFSLELYSLVKNVKRSSRADDQEPEPPPD